MNRQRKGDIARRCGNLPMLLALALGACAIHIDQLPETARDHNTVEQIPEELKNGYTRPRAAVITPANQVGAASDHDATLTADLGGILGRVGGLIVVEKREMDEVLKTIEQNLSDLVDQSKLNEVPGLESVSHLVVAHVTHADAIEEEVEVAPPAKPGDRPTTTKVMNANVGISLRVVQVSTGVVLRDIRKQGATSSYFSSFSGSTPASLIADAIHEAANASLPELQSLFPARGYIIRLKGDAQVALISLGQRDQIGEGRHFRLFQRNKYRDPLGVDREETTTIGELKAIAVLDDTAWCEVLEGRDRILIGQEVESLPESQNIFEALFGS